MSHYETLGVGESATADEVKRAYKKLAKKHHPDANPNDSSAEEKFKKISAAYAVIGDANKRAQYDNEQKMRASGMPSGFGGFGGFSGFDPFSNFMGGTSPFDLLREAGKALNIQTALQINFLDAKESQVQPVKFHRRKPCAKCRGTGAKDYHATACPTCRGRGSVTRTLGGVLHTTQMCQTCKGKGKLVKTKCAHCKEGSNIETAEINVHIPAGIVTNKVLRLQGEGHRAADGKGDLLIKIIVASDSRWARNGATVMSTTKVTYPTLVLGGDVEIETIWGKERVKIPPKTKSGSKLALHNKGFPRLGKILPDERGAHLLTVELDLPSDNSKQHRDLLKELQEFYNK
jgi:molecular chaperone DnaJ